jgi:hypothetical protein
MANIYCNYCLKNYKINKTLKKHLKICKYKKIEDPKVDTIEDPKVDTIEDPKVDSIEDPKIDSIEDPKVDSIEDPKIDSIEDPKIDSIEDPKVDTTNKFMIENYINDIKNEINRVINLTKNEDIIEDILLNNFIKKNIEKFKYCKKIKQLQMNIGNIWQYVIGNYYNFENLKQNHITGLDIKSDNLKIIIELKNRYNTDNSSSRKTNYDKLVKFKKNNLEWKCIYAVINDKTTEGKEYKLIHDDYEIIYLSGNKLLNFIFGKNKDIILDTIKNEIMNI